MPQANLLEGLLDLIKDEKAEPDPVTQRPRQQELSALQRVAALSRGARQLAVNAFINFPATIAQALSPVDLSFSQPLLDYLNQRLGAIEAETGQVPPAPRLADIRAPVPGQTTRPFTSGLLGLFDEPDEPGVVTRLARATGVGPLYEQAKTRSETTAGAVARTLSEATVAPLTQRTDFLPDVPGVLDEERKKETEVQRLERLPESIAQASILYSMFAGALGLIKRQPRATFGPAKNAVRQVEKDAAIMNELAKRKITDGIKEGVEVYTPDGRGKITEVIGLEDIRQGLSKQAKKKFFKGIKPKDKRVIVTLDDGVQVGYKPQDLVVNPRSVINATGMKPGRLLLDPVRLRKLIEDETGKEVGLTPELAADFLNTTINEAGPALAHKVGQLMKEDTGLQVMEAVGRAIAQGEAPEVKVAAISKLYRISPDKAAELIATTFKQAGDAIAKGNFRFNRTKLANMMEIASMMDPEIAGQLHQTARDLYLDNPVTRGRLNRFFGTWKQLKDGSMLSSLGGFSRDLRQSVTRGSIIQVFEDLITDTTVAVGSPIAQRVIGSREAAGLPTRDMSQIYANSLGTLQALAMGGQHVLTRAKDYLKLPLNPEFRKWVSEASMAELRGDPIPPRPKGLRTRTDLDAIMDLAQEFPVRFSDMSRALGGDSLLNMVAVDQIAKASQSVRNLRRRPSLQNISRATIESLKAAANLATTLRSLADIEMKRVGVAAKILSHSRATGKSVGDLMKELQSSKALDPITERAFIGAFEHGREITYSRRFDEPVDLYSTVAGGILRAHQKYPILYTLSGVEYPGFQFNKINYLWERNPIRAGLSMVKPSTLRKLAGEIDQVELQANLDARGIRDASSPEGLAISKALRERAMNDAAKEYARFASGIVQMGLAIGLRTSKYAGPKWHEFDLSAVTGEVGPDGQRQIESLQYDDPLATWLMAAEAVKATSEGIPLQDRFTKQELINLAVGTRNLDQNSVFALQQLADIFEREGTVEPGIKKVATDLLDTEFGKLFSGLRQLKDVAALADMRALGFEGSDELQLPDRKQTDFPNIVGVLPNDNKFREWLIPPTGEQAATLYETDGMTRRETSIAQVLFGFRFDKQIPLQRFMGVTGLNIRDAVGQGFPDPVMDKAHTFLFNNILQAPIDDKGLTVGNAIILYANEMATIAANSEQPEIIIQGETFPLVGPKTAIFHEVQRYVATKAFESIRSETRDATIAEFASSDPTKLSKFVEQSYPRIVRPSIKEFFEQLRRERAILKNEQR